MKIVIDGAGEVGTHLAKMLSLEANDIAVIENDPAKIERLTSMADVITYQGAPTSIKAMKEAQVQDADLFIAVVPSLPQDVNIVAALIARNLGAKKVTARIDDEEYLAPENKLLFKQMGIELMFHPEKLAADEIVDVLKHSQATDAMDLGHGKLQIEVFKIEENSPLLDMKLAEFAAVAASSDFQFRVIAVSRNGKTIMPKPETKFMYNDHVFIISTREGMGPLMKYLGKATVEVDRVMIIGGTQIAELVAAKLADKVETVKMIVKDKARAMELSEKLDDRIIVINGDGRNTDLLVEEGIKDFDAFAALTENDEANVLSCVVAKQFGVDRAIAEVENTEYIRLAEEMGVDTVINKKLITAGRLFKYTLSGRARLVKYMSGTDAEVLEYNVAPGSAITKGPLKDIGFPNDAVIGGLIRGAESIIAVGSTVIQPYDRVAVFALPQAVKAVDKFFK